MNIVEYYHNLIVNNVEDDFQLFPFREGFYIGFDKEGNLCTIIKAKSQNASMFRQKTKLLSIECNKKISVEEANNKSIISAHIVRCYAKEDKEKELFLELIDAMIVDLPSDDEVLEVFQTLIRFFANTSEPSDSELIGLYAEVDAILHFYPSIDIAKYWQSKDRLKFDFSFSDKLKLEVKATLRDFRTHHFRHDQLATDLLDVYILSYMLRYDDEGVSLYEHLINVKPLLSGNIKKLLRINTILKNVSEDRLKDLRFSPEYTDLKRHIYDAHFVPRFNEITPDGVANAEYDCNLDNISPMDETAFIELVKNTISGDNDE